MTTLLDLTLPRSLDQLLARAERERPQRIEAWLFEDKAARRAAESRLAEWGISARLRSAYKPLLHAFMEELGTAGLSEVRISAPAAWLQRVRVESYPLAALIAPARLSFEAVEDVAPRAAGLLPVQVHIDGREHAVALPLKADGSACGWLRWTPARPDPDATESAAWRTDYEAAFESVMAAVAAHPWPVQTPFFEQLLIDIRMPGIERGLPVGDEVISTREALHEDFYFALLQLFHQRSGLPLGDRTLQPGQIIPNIVAAAEDAELITVQLRLCPHAQAAQAPVPAPVVGPWAAIQRPLHPAQVQALLPQLPGERFEYRSHQGRPVLGLHRPGSQPPVLITAGQHANETSGVVGALRAAEVLAQDPEAHFALVAMENPDGAALHQWLMQHNPRHMLHAARFTALGDDLEVRKALNLGEKGAREEGIDRTRAGLHFSLHGYPAHEWTRPLSGYLPPGNEEWTLPRGFFLIMRHHPGRDPWPFLQALTAELAQDLALRELNAAQLALWDSHWGPMAHPVLNGIVCMVSEDRRSRVPFTLITEYPDETVYGAAFQLAHTSIQRTVLVGTRLYREGLLGDPALVRALDAPPSASA